MARKKVPKGTPERQTGRPGAPRSAPRRPKSTPSRARERKHRVLVVRPGCNAVSKRIFVNLYRFSVFSQSLRTLRSTAHASKNRGSAHRAASRVARATGPRKTTKIGPEIGSKSSKIASLGYSGAFFRLTVAAWSGSGERSTLIEPGRSSKADRARSIVQPD